jgi:hypothetical protein
MLKLLVQAAAADLARLAQMQAAAAELGHIGLAGFRYKAQQWHVLLAQLEQLEQSIQVAQVAQPQSMETFLLAAELVELGRH